MKMHITTAALVLAAAPAFSQSAMTGVSHPDSAVISSTDDTVQQTPIAKPSADVPAVVAPASPATAYGPYVPYRGATVAGSNMMTAEASADDPNDPDAMVVTSVPERNGTLREGTLLKTQIKETLATDKTVAGSRFSATVTEAIERNGRVIIPVGSVLEGRVTEVRGGRRITGAALLHLETSDVTLPDGTHYIVHAQLVDTGKSEFNVDNEGTLKRKDHAKETLAIVGGVTGAGAATGALVGGGVGAVVGAGIGAGVSTVMWLKQDRQATLPKDELLVFSLTTPMILTPLSGSPVSSLTTGGVGVAGATQ
ncbi:hypothetical protein [Tunturibacter empetritectus]|uniref:TrbI/VirB10 family protein n=2 Tax=Tunturiibacter empetritectus TaxID=3069691 RepID=A0A7W8IFY3_9BACT|nr:hypothetical protein [Edaphobacter lichenicola]MBB5315651.1 hypothetical protein [Edaphobacter lichenicola]